MLKTVTDKKNMLEPIVSKGTRWVLRRGCDKLRVSNSPKGQ